jgi:hypothetical protein
MPEIRLHPFLRVIIFLFCYFCNTLLSSVSSFMPFLSERQQLLGELETLIPARDVGACGVHDVLGKPPL